MLGQIVGGWTLTGIHNYRSGGTISVFDSRMKRQTGFPFRPDIVEGVDPIIFDGSHLDVVNGTPYLNPGGVCDPALVGARRSVADRHGAGGPRCPRAGVLLRGSG